MDENIEDELNFLCQAAFIYSQKQPSLSRQLLYQFHSKSTEIGVEIVPTTYCAKCYSVYIPGLNCQVSTVNTFTKNVLMGKRLQSGKVGERIYYNCKVCYTTIMHAISAKVTKLEVEETPKPILSQPAQETPKLPVPVAPSIAPKPSKKAKKKKNLEQLLAKKGLDAKKPSLSLDDFLNNL